MSDKPLRLRCEYFKCLKRAVAHHAPSCTNLCDEHFNVNERKHGCLFTRDPLKRTYKSMEMK